MKKPSVIMLQYSWFQQLCWLLLFIPSVIFSQDLFPDGTSIPGWFFKVAPAGINTLGKQYRITEHGVANDSLVIQTDKIQAVIEKAAQYGGVVVIPEGTFLSGAVFFKKGTHLYLEKGAVLKGSDDISDFPIVMTRIEGQTVNYFPALVNADAVNGFTVSGSGTINGNGLRYWKAFWLRRQFNPQCTNMDEMRPRLLYVSNSRDVQVSGISLKDSPFWTTHFYKCENVKLLNLRITSPAYPVKAPSTDAVDIDACTNFLIKGCYMSVNDDAVALKGGKGPKADKDGNNGENRNILIEDNIYGFCHSALTCGSESIHNYNVLFRRCTIDKAQRLLHLKMRPDTPQNYEYITLQDIKGNAGSMINIKPWTQFFDLKGEKDIKLSYAGNVLLKNIKLDCDIVFDIEKSAQYILSDFRFENLLLRSQNESMQNTAVIKNVVMKNVNITK